MFMDIVAGEEATIIVNSGSNDSPDMRTVVEDCGTEGADADDLSHDVGPPHLDILQLPEQRLRKGEERKKGELPQQVALAQEVQQHLEGIEHLRLPQAALSAVVVEGKEHGLQQQQKEHENPISLSPRFSLASATP